MVLPASKVQPFYELVVVLPASKVEPFYELVVVLPSYAYWLLMDDEYYKLAKDVSGASWSRFRVSTKCPPLLELPQ